MMKCFKFIRDKLDFLLFLTFLGVKNLKRNPRRSILTIIAISLGLASLVFTDGLNEGLKRHMVLSATQSLSGHLQIHLDGFRENFKVEKCFDYSVFQELRSFLKKEVKAIAPRVIFRGMLSSAEESKGVMIYGIIPEYEKEVSKIDDTLYKGEYFKNTKGNYVLIGKKLAEHLRVGIGEKLILTTGDIKGELVQEVFIVKGIFRTGLKNIDENLIFIPLSTAQTLLNLGNKIHEIVYLLNNAYQSKALKPLLIKKLQEKYQKRYEVLSWEEFFPSLASTIRMFDFSVVLMTLLLFMLVSLLIGNTLIMSFQERYFEFGVLLALGTSPGHIRLMILAEVAGLAFFSIIIGLILGELVNFFFYLKGIPYAELQLGGVSISEPIRTIIVFRQFWLYPLLLLIFSLVIGSYYAYRASVINPAEVIVKTL